MITHCFSPASPSLQWTFAVNWAKFAPPNMSAAQGGVPIKNGQVALTRIYGKPSVVYHDVCVHMPENVQSRSMTYVCTCKRTSNSVAWLAHPTPPTPPTPPQRKRTSRSVAPRVCVCVNVTWTLLPHPTPTHPKDKIGHKNKASQTQFLQNPYLKKEPHPNNSSRL